jgi:hypothetical protein
MKFKNERATVIHMPDNSLLLPDSQVEIKEEDKNNPSLVSMFKARWLSPQDEEATAHVEQLRAKEKGATAGRLAKIEQNPRFSAEAKKRAKDNAASIAEAEKKVLSRQTPQEELRSEKRTLLDDIQTATIDTLMRYAKEHGSDPEIMAACEARVKELQAPPPAATHDQSPVPTAAAAPEAPKP